MPTMRDSLADVRSAHVEVHGPERPTPGWDALSSGKYSRATLIMLQFAAPHTAADNGLSSADAANR